MNGSISSSGKLIVVVVVIIAVVVVVVSLQGSNCTKGVDPAFGKHLWELMYQHLD